MTLAEKMKVAYYYNNHKVVIKEETIPEPGFGELLIKTKACGVCVADTMEWYLTDRAPLSLGHEPTGVVAKVGEGVENFSIGDRVAVHHHVPCLICEHCRKGNFTMCETFKNTHIHPGGFSEYFIASSLHVERDIHKLPENLSFEVGTLMEPLACVIHAIRKAGITQGERVVLIGTGAMGLLFIQALRYWGIRDLIVYELIDWRKQKALEFGAPHVLSPLDDIEKEQNRMADIFSHPGAEKVIIAAKDLSAMNFGMQLAAKGGTILFFATPHPDEWIKLYPSQVFFNELTLTSSYSADHLDTRLALELLENGDVDGKAIISELFPMEQLSEAILKTAGREHSLKNVIVFD
jgi:L-iditol 2-dehydrogenase